MLHETLNWSSLLDARSYEIFGQGSRVNDTFIEPTSDIDLVLMLKMPFRSNVDNLDGPGTSHFTQCNRAEPYKWEDFRDDVLTTLSKSYVVHMGRRCVTIDAPQSLFGEMVDILLATEYRLYLPSPSPGVEIYEQGVFFRDREGRPIVNFPKQHRRNGDQKELRTGGRFKEVVRAAKRVRNLAEQELMIAEDAAPSYLIECLLYNVPDNIYEISSAGEAYNNAIDWLRRLHYEAPAPFADLYCQNGINRLFGEGPDQWSVSAAANVINVLYEIRGHESVAAR